MTTERITRAELRERITQTGSFYFSRKTLQFFGQTMRDFASTWRVVDGHAYGWTRAYPWGGRSTILPVKFDLTTGDATTYYDNPQSDPPGRIGLEQYADGEK
jgi:hypothetical protein